MLLFGSVHGTELWGYQASADQRKLGVVAVTQALVGQDTLRGAMYLELHPESLQSYRRGSFASASTGRREDLTPKSIWELVLLAMVGFPYHKLTQPRERALSLNQLFCLSVHPEVLL